MSTKPRHSDPTWKLPKPASKQQTSLSASSREADVTSFGIKAIPPFVLPSSAALGCRAASYCTLLQCRLQHWAAGRMRDRWQEGTWVWGAGGVLGVCWSWRLQKMVRLKIGCGQPSYHANCLFSLWPTEMTAAAESICPTILAGQDSTVLLLSRTSCSVWLLQSAGVMQLSISSHMHPSQVIPSFKKFSKASVYIKDELTHLHLKDHSHAPALANRKGQVLKNHWTLFCKVCNSKYSPKKRSEIWVIQHKPHTFVPALAMMYLDVKK